MVEGRFTVKLNLVEGVLELDGDDKDWIAQQLDKLAPVLAQAQGTKSPAPRETRKSPDPEEKGPQGKDEPRRTRRAAASSARLNRNPELEKLLTKEVKASLEAFRAERMTHWDKGVSSRLAILATFLADELDWSHVDGSDLYTLLSVMGWPSPATWRSALGNARDRDKYFTGVADGKLQLTHKGENYGRHDSKVSGKPAK